jgi:hypothetical protein
MACGILIKIHLLIVPAGLLMEEGRRFEAAAMIIAQTISLKERDGYWGK